MSKYNYSEVEQQINKVLKYQSEQLKKIEFKSRYSIEENIASSEALLKSLGYEIDVNKVKADNSNTLFQKKEVVVLPNWKNLCMEAEKVVGKECKLESIFTSKELESNERAIQMMNQEFNMLHKLDNIDIGISVIAGIVGACIDILLVGIPEKGYDGLEAKPLSNYIRKIFDAKFPQDEMEKLANSKISKVPYDAQDNRNTQYNVVGLSAYYHRLLSLGHDPLVGLIVGVSDILQGKMTTIDKTGKIISQNMQNYADRRESNIFEAITKQFIHFKSDITTSMGLPAPLMGLFNLFQFGSIGEEEQTIAQIVQGMYYEGYDFIHFCSMSISTMVIEVIIRMGYAFKRIKQEYSIKESIPISLNRNKHPKLATMLFMGHSAATAINAGKIYFTKNPLSINYAQWLAFTKYSYKQLKWSIFEKNEKKQAYVNGKINEELDIIFNDIDKSWNEFTKNYIVVIE